MYEPAEGNKLLQQINDTAHNSYATQGLGIGAADEALGELEKYTDFRLCAGMAAVEIGCGEMKLVRKIAIERKARIDAYDLVVDSERLGALLAEAREVGVRNMISVMPTDVCHDRFISDHDIYDAAFCTETIEHLSNPYFMVSNVKRGLKHGGYFVLSYPMPEDNLGYGGGKHAHVYPGFLLREPFEHFMRQMYFKQVHRHANGSSAWYVFKNYKGPGVTDVFSMTSANYDDERMFDCLRDFV